MNSNIFIKRIALLLCAGLLYALPSKAQLFFNQADDGVHIMANESVYIEGGVQLSGGAVSTHGYFDNSGAVHVGYDQSASFATLAGNDWTNNNAAAALAEEDGMDECEDGTVYMYQDDSRINGSSLVSAFNTLTLGGPAVYTSSITVFQDMDTETDDVLALQGNELDLTTTTVRVMKNSNITNNGTGPCTDGDFLEPTIGDNDFATGWINTEENVAFVIWETSGVGGASSGPASSPYLIPVGADAPSQSGNIHYHPIELAGTSGSTVYVRYDQNEGLVEQGGTLGVAEAGGPLIDLEQEFYHTIFVEGVAGAVSMDVTFWVDYLDSDGSTSTCTNPSTVFIEYAEFNGVTWDGNTIDAISECGTLQGYTVNAVDINDESGPTDDYTLSLNNQTPNNCILPIELLSLNAVPVNNEYIKVKWVTSEQVNTLGFDVERSEDGVTFKKIGWVDGHGTTTQEMSYFLDDYDVNKNVIYYYRLNAVDFDGTSSHTEIVSAMLRDKNGTIGLASIYPNPVFGNQDASIVIESYFDQNVHFKVVNNLGQIFLNETLNLREGANTIQLPASKWAQGTYHISITDETGVHSRVRSIVVAK